MFRYGGRGWSVPGGRASYLLHAGPRPPYTLKHTHRTIQHRLPGRYVISLPPVDKCYRLLFLFLSLLFDIVKAVIFVPLVCDTLQAKLVSGTLCKVKIP